MVVVVVELKRLKWKSWPNFVERLKGGRLVLLVKWKVDDLFYSSGGLGLKH